MASGGTNVIREFLVALGFRTDESALKNFTSGIAKASKAAIGLGAAVTAMATTVAIGVERFASNLEALYFASLRTNSAATNLMAFDRSMQNFGASAGEGLAAVEGLAHALRTNPGNEGMLTGLLGQSGLQLKHMKDGSVDAEDAVRKLAKTFQTVPMFYAEQLAAQFGMSEKVMLGLRDPRSAADFLRVLGEVKSQNLEKATQDANRFQTAVRDLTIYLQAFGIQVYDAIARKFGGSLESVGKWLQANGPMLADRIADVLKRVLDLAVMITPAIKWLVDKFIELDKATGGWSTRIIALLAVLRFLGAGQIIGGVLGLAGAFLRLGGGIAMAATSSSALLVALTALAAWKAGSLINDQLSDDTKGGIGEFLARTGSYMGVGSAKEAFAVNNPLQFLMDESRGQITRDQAIGMLANFKRESGLSPTAVNGSHYGIAQWDTNRQQNFAAVVGHDIHGSSTAEQLDFVLFEMLKGQEQRAGILLRGQSNAANAARVVSSAYERHNEGTKEEDKRAQLAAQMSNETTINVYGVSDPVAAGNAVAGHQDRVYARAARQFN